MIGGQGQRRGMAGGAIEQQTQHRHHPVPQPGQPPAAVPGHQPPPVTPVDPARLGLMPPQPPLEKYFAGLKFKDKAIDDKLQKRIIQYIFIKQAEKRQKEKEWFG